MGCEELSIKLGLKRPPLPKERYIPLGPRTKAYYKPSDYSLEKLYGKNEIITSRYTWYGFLFQNLSEQAQRIANFYFICVAVIQLFTDSPVTPITSIIPLVFVFSVTMIKQGYEDYLRHKADREVNGQRFEIVTPDGQLKVIKAMDITVGDIVLCRDNATFPCDLIVISTSESTGECFITTSSLDGETNLKRFVAPESTSKHDRPDIIANLLDGDITCQQPINDFYSFTGRITVQPEDGPEIVSPLGPANLLLRGACLRNTDFVYGCAIYTGSQTKLALNSKGKKIKFSQVERKLNVYLLLIVVLLVIASIVSTIPTFTVSTDKWWFIERMKTTPWNIVQTFLGYIVLYNYIIPISLYVTIELQKFMGSRFFEYDDDLYDDRINEHAKANTSDLIEEMGQVEYLFSDKTGTLTENKMLFRRMAIHNHSYILLDNNLFETTGLSPEEIISKSSQSHFGPEHQLFKGTLPSTPEDDVLTPGSTRSNDRQSVMNLFPPLAAARRGTLEGSLYTDSLNYTPLHVLLLHLALCHTVRVEQNLAPEEQLDQAVVRRRFARAVIGKLIQANEAPKSGSSALRRASAAKSATAAVRVSKRGRRIKSSQYNYQAASPDEKSFVEACRSLNIIFHGQDESGMQVVSMGGLANRYRLLDVLEFDSTRKCMSVIVQPVIIHTDTNEYPVIVLCKGAETAIISKSARGPSNAAVHNSLSVANLSDEDLFYHALLNSRDFLSTMSEDDVMRHVTEFACEGLRTLVMGMRLLSWREWLGLKAQLDRARGQLEDRDEAVAVAMASVETELQMIGCTGIEDMLQEGVPDTIAALREAGIQVWILTGDKEETAVNISYSAGHFYKNMNEIRLVKQASSVDALFLLRNQLEKIAQVKSQDEHVTFGIVVDGQTLNFLLEPGLRERFVECCLAADTVLCCRLTPLQKSEVVRLIKTSRKPEPVTAAIGDGANDVSMILEAHIGFGIFGLEGRQAVRAADYAFGRFKHLKCTILYHGYTYYTRIAVLTLYFFYKNLTFTWPQMLYSFFCLYSSVTVYPQVYLILFNITMTSLPVILYGLFEQPLPKHILLTHPHLYRENTGNSGMSFKRFLPWAAISLWHGFVSFFGTYLLTFRGQIGPGNGPSTGFHSATSIGNLVCFGNFLVIAILIIVNLRMLLVSYYLNSIILLVSVSIFIFNIIIFIFLNNVLLPFEATVELFGSFSAMWSGSGIGTGWFGLIVLVALALIPDFILRAWDDQGWVWRLAKLEEERLISHEVLRGSSMAVRTNSWKNNNGQTNLRPQSPARYYTNPTFEDSGNRVNLPQFTTEEEDESEDTSLSERRLHQTTASALTSDRTQTDF